MTGATGIKQTRHVSIHQGRSKQDQRLNNYAPHNISKVTRYKCNKSPQNTADNKIIMGKY
jgi:hypothetical protein